jgi:hypothetical protein
VVYGMAKDFGVSGLRVGALASRNQELLDAHTNLVQKTKKFFGLSHFYTGNDRFTKTGSGQIYDVPVGQVEKQRWCFLQGYFAMIPGTTQVYIYIIYIFHIFSYIRTRSSAAWNHSTANGMARPPIVLHYQGQYIHAICPAKLQIA